MLPKHAMIFAAGLGTRLRPLTNDRPKALVEIKGLSLLEIQLRRLKAYGFETVTVNIHHFADQVESFLKSKDWGMEIFISDERELLLDTGGGIRKALKFWGNAKEVFVINVDVLSDLDPKKLMEVHRSNKALATLALRDRKTSRYLIFDNKMRLEGWENKQTGEIKGKKSDDSQALAFSGIQIIDTALVKMMPENQPFSIIESYLSNSESGKILGYLQNDGIWLDVGKPAELQSAAELLSKINEDQG